MPRYDLTTTGPSAADEIRVPGRREAPYYEPELPENPVAVLEITAHLLMAGIIFFAIWWNESDVRWALLAGVAYFGGATTTRVLAKTGTIKDIVRAALDHLTERHRINTLADLEERRYDLLEIEARARTLPTVSADPVQPPAANYVSAYTPEDIRDAYVWAMSFYGPDGHPKRAMLHGNGKIRGPVIGSQRAGGNQAARQYLLDRGFLAMHQGGGWVNLRKYPTALELARLRR